MSDLLWAAHELGHVCAALYLGASDCVVLTCDPDGGFTVTPSAPQTDPVELLAAMVAGAAAELVCVGRDPVALFAAGGGTLSAIFDLSVYGEEDADTADLIASMLPGPLVAGAVDRAARAGRLAMLRDIDRMQDVMRRMRPGDAIEIRAANRPAAAA